MKSVSTSFNKNVKKIIFAGFVSLTMMVSAGCSNVFAQVTQLEQAASSYSGPIPTGPVTSAKARFANNISAGKFAETTTDLNVIASFSNQTYTNINGVNDLNGNFFGGTANFDEKKVEAQAAWRAMNIISDPSNETFTSNPTGQAKTGINVDLNYGFNVFTAVDPLFAASKSTNGRYYYSRLTLKFNRAVSNPVLHLVGLGAWTRFNGNQLGYSTELELVNNGNITLTKLSGSDALNVTSTKILNNKETIDADTDNGAASGSIRIVGNNITTVTFDIYLRGDGKGNNWSTDNLFSGDQWMMGFSMNTPSIAGNVFNDGNGLTDSKVNAAPSGTNASNSLRINVVNSNNQVIATTDVAEDGSYFFQDIAPATYKLVLSTSSTSNTPSLPNGWVFTGENIGSADSNGNDNNVDGIVTTVTLNSSTSSVFDVNFGIDKTPVADAKSKTINAPANGVVIALDGTGEAPKLSGSDLEDGEMGGLGSKVVITRFPVNGKLFYGADNNEIEISKLNATFANVFNPSYLKVKLAGSGYKTVNFDYAFVDAAGMQGASSKYELKWETTLPVTLAKFTATRVEQTALLSWSTTAETNSDRFEIEHSNSGKEWRMIGTVESKGESAELLAYSFSDREPVAGENLYRLKMIDKDGSFAYSRINSVSFDVNTEIAAYPNPAVNFVKIKVDGQDNWNKVNAVKLFNMAGNVVASGKMTANELDVTGLASGFYLVQVTRTNGLVSTSKIVIRK